MPSGEASTRSIVCDALHGGKTVFVPYIYKERSGNGGATSSVMDMVSLFSEDDYKSLQADNWGIPTPDKSSLPEREHVLGNVSMNPENPETSAGKRKLDMIIMPGVAFDRDRRRLGHGKGFYDTFLSRYHSRGQTGQGDQLNMDRGKQGERNDMPRLGEFVDNIRQNASGSF